MLNSNGFIRLYDVRAGRRPYLNHKLLMDKQHGQLTKIMLKTYNHNSIIGTNFGDIYQFDRKKNFMPIGRFKGVNGEVTGLC